MPEADKIAQVVRPSRDGYALYTAMGAALVGTLLGGIAVYMGLTGHGDRLGDGASAALSASGTSAGAASGAAAESGAPVSVPSSSSGEARPPTAGYEEPSVVPGLAQVVGATMESVVCLSFAPGDNAPSFAGAGVIYNASGYVLTNYHVVEPMLRARRSRVARLGTKGRLSARFVDGRVLDATVVLESPEEDLAVLKLEGLDPELPGPPAVQFGRSRELSVGETVFSIGCPVGLEHSVSAGIVAALNRTGVMPNRHLPTIQLDASINLGNSGGPLFDGLGRLVGITSARSSRGEGIGFAIPIDRVRVHLRAVDEGERGRSGVIGAIVSAAPDARGSIGELGYNVGLTVDAVDEGGPAQGAGVLTGDVIVEIRGRRHDGAASMLGQQARLDFLRQFMDVARNLLPGEELELTMAREGKAVPVNIVVQAASQAEQARIDIEGVLGLRLYEGTSPMVLGFVPGSSLEGNRQAQKLLLDARITVVGTQEIHSVEDLGRVAGTLKPLAAEARGRKVRVRLVNKAGQSFDVSYPLDWRR